VAPLSRSTHLPLDFYLHLLAGFAQAPWGTGCRAPPKSCRRFLLAGWAMTGMGGSKRKEIGPPPRRPCVVRTAWRHRPRPERQADRLKVSNMLREGKPRFRSDRGNRSRLPREAKVAGSGAGPIDAADHDVDGRSGKRSRKLFSRRRLENTTCTSGAAGAEMRRRKPPARSLRGVSGPNSRKERRRGQAAEMARKKVPLRS